MFNNIKIEVLREDFKGITFKYDYLKGVVQPIVDGE